MLSKEFLFLHVNSYHYIHIDGRDDLLRAIRKLRILGNGFTVLNVGNLQLVQSVPGELTMDHTNVLQSAQVTYDSLSRHGFRL